MNMDFNLLKKSIGKRLMFKATFLLEDRSLFTDKFYAFLREVDLENSFLVV